jgi:hypothetical protein
MNKKALTKHDIHRKLTGFSEHDLQAIRRLHRFNAAEEAAKGQETAQIAGDLERLRY